MTYEVRDDGEQEARADRGGDHPRVDPAAEHRRDLLADRELVHQRVAPDAEEHVRDDEVDRRVAVPPMPDGEPVEADEPLERTGSRASRITWMSARYALRRPVIRATLVSASPVVVARRLPPWAQSQTIPRGVAEHDRPDEREPDRSGRYAAERLRAGRARDRHLGHGAHSSNGF